jgi:hypothetical protein
MLNLKQLLAIRDKYLLNADSDEKKDVLTLLNHIQECHELNTSRARAAYEVFEMGVKYSRRVIHEMVWTKTEAKILARHHNCHYGVMHAIKINGQWHRVYVTPLKIEGNPETAELSHLTPNRKD